MSKKTCECEKRCRCYRPSGGRPSGGISYEEAIRAIQSNYPQSGYTVLREALDLAMELLEEKNSVGDGE